MKKKLLFLLITILAVALCCTACSREEEIPELTIKSIAVVENTVPTTINLGKDPDFSGIKVTVTYSDDSTKEVGYADVTLGTIDTTTKGEKTVSVIYGDAYTSFKVTVVDPEDSAYVTAIRIVPAR